MADHEKLFETIKPVAIEDELKKSYLDYAMSVIVGRALPDVRDGLKPVHRRVLYTMHLQSNTYNRAFKKSARIVGDVMGRFHPHGDSAIYDTVVRLTQEFSLRYPMINGQGNFGSIDGDNAAAMRYTEVRMQRIAGDLLQDLDKDTVDFRPNYDGQDMEPVVLPSRIPNLLVNGSDGIAVGMATKIPPHNLNEVCEALIHLTKKPKATNEELMQIVKGPDFPTGGFILGREGIAQAYKTGRGVVTMRAKAHTEDTKGKKDRESIIVTELPYQQNKARLMEKIAELVRDKRLDGVSDLRDESDRDGIRMVVELKRGENADVVLNNLYKLTSLQTSYGIIFMSIVDGQPRTLTLIEMLQCFLDFRREVVVRRTRYQLREAEKRAHILEGLKIALDNLDAVIALIRGSKNPEEARTGLIANFALSEIQAKAILEMRLQRLTGLERDKILEEYRDIIALIADLKDILNDDARIRKIIIQETKEVVKAYGDERRTVITEEASDINIEALIAEEKMVVTLSHLGFIKRTPLDQYRVQKRGGRGRRGMATREEDFVEHLKVCSTHDYILIFTSFGRLFWQKVYSLPEVGQNAKGKAIVNLIKLEKHEKVRALLATREFPEDQFIVFCSRLGRIKKTAMAAYSNLRSAALKAVSIDQGDQLENVGVCKEGDRILLATRKGRCIQFNQEDVRAMGRTARGVTGIRLKEDDRVIGMEVVHQDDKILTITDNGYGKRTPIKMYRLQGRGGSGVINIKVTEKNGSVVAIRAVGDDDEIMAITEKGLIIRTEAGTISIIGRSTQGVKVIRTEENDRVVSVAKVVDEQVDGEVVEGEEDTEDSKPTQATLDE